MVCLFYELLLSPCVNWVQVLEQALWLLGNLAGEGAAARDAVLEKKALQPLVRCLERHQVRARGRSKGKRAFAIPLYVGPVEGGPRIVQSRFGTCVPFLRGGPKLGVEPGEGKGEHVPKADLANPVAPWPSLDPGKVHALRNIA